MKLLFDEDLVEAVVFLCASGRRGPKPALQIRRFQAARERLYSILDPDERNAAFFRLNLDWFREWGVEELLRGILKDFPLFEQGLSALAFRKARARNDEAAELFVHPEQGRRGIVAVRGERFGSDESVRCLLNHELTHLSDMLDPAFGYSPELALPVALRASERLVRERYRLLWDVTIDGRLTQRKLATEMSRDRHWIEFERAFGFWGEEQRRQTFDSLWMGPGPQHEALMSMAADPRNLRAAHQPLPGAPCPLCGFATFDWAPVAAMEPKTIDAIRAEFPAWTKESGVCARCVEIYQLLPCQN